MVKVGDDYYMTFMRHCFAQGVNGGNFQVAIALTKLQEAEAKFQAEVVAHRFYYNQTRKAVGDFIPEDNKWSWTDLWEAIKNMRERITQLSEYSTELELRAELVDELEQKTQDLKDRLDEKTSTIMGLLALLTDLAEAAKDQQ
jgi:TolA-binding protein